MAEVALSEELDECGVLVVDYHDDDRATLANLLSSLDYKVLEAKDGRRAVAMFREHRPWLVITEAYLPELDGFEAVRQIKQAAGEAFVTALFVTRSRDDTTFERCVDAGGDDFLPAPLTSLAVLKAKLVALKRIVQLYREVQGLHQVLQREEEVAETLLSGAIEGDNAALDRVRIYKRPASTFCGDVHLTAYRPDGDLNVLLGDFTGHGLTSVIGALPLSETFRAMTRKGYSGEEVLQQINLKLKSLLPPGMFLACTLVQVCSTEKQVYIWNCGMPDALVLSGSDCCVKAEVGSADPPLGIMANFTPCAARVISVEPEDRVLLISDGVQEARNPEGEMFGDERLQMAACDGMAVHNLSDRVMFAINSFMNGRVQDDDVSLIEIPGSVNAPVAETAAVFDVGTTSVPAGDHDGGWVWAVQLEGRDLQRVNPVPMLISKVQEMEGNGEHWQVVYTILSELYTNALDHGVLGVDSALKSSAEGFARYFEVRDERLSELTGGSVSISVAFQPRMNAQTRVGGHLKIAVSDSGYGFDVSSWMDAGRRIEESEPLAALSGRGICLVRELADTLEYLDGGRTAEVSFSW